MHCDYQTRQVCARNISFDIQDGVVSHIQFLGGCNGNLKAISKLVEGWPADKINSYLRGNTCGSRPTSCADQLAQAVMAAKEEELARKNAG